MSAPSMPRVYYRTLDPKGQDSLAKLARQVYPGAKVLDLGTGPGVLGRYLAEELGCTVDGVESNPVAAAEAAPWYRHLECADLESITLAGCFTGSQYDFIICADVLEHLRRPGDVLAQLAGLLAPHGQVLASAPNAAYAGLIAELLDGEFRYRPEGLLDETHLHFFTLKSLNRLLEEQCLRITAVDSVLCDLRQSEFTDRYLDALPPALTRTLLGRPEALVYQFIVAAMAADQLGDSVSPVLTTPPPELRFACQLFWRWAGVEYQRSESSASWGRLGMTHQTLALSIPACPAPPVALRLDLADRPGLLRLYGITLHDGAGGLLWAWDGQRRSLAAQPGQQLVFAELAPLAEGVTALLTGDDPQLELPIPVSALMTVKNGGELRLELSWPMSLDYLSLVQDCIPRRDAIAEQTFLNAQIAELESRHAALLARTMALETAILEQAVNKELEQQVDELRMQLAAQTAQLAGKTALEQQRDMLLEQKSAELTALQASRSWRLTAPLRNSACWLRRWLR